MREAALAGAGIAYLWEASIVEDIAAGRLIEVLKDWSVTSPGLSLYYPDRRHVPISLQAFIAVLRERFPSRPRVNTTSR